MVSKRPHPDELALAASEAAWHRAQAACHKATAGQTELIHWIEYCKPNETLNRAVAQATRRVFDELWPLHEDDYNDPGYADEKTIRQDAIDLARERACEGLMIFEVLSRMPDGELAMAAFDIVTLDAKIASLLLKRRQAES